jgi:hypothetical protein
MSMTVGIILMWVFIAIAGGMLLSALGRAASHSDHEAQLDLLRGELALSQPPVVRPRYTPRFLDLRPVSSANLHSEVL